MCIDGLMIERKIVKRENDRVKGRKVDCLSLWNRCFYIEILLQTITNKRFTPEKYFIWQMNAFRIFYVRSLIF